MKILRRKLWYLIECDCGNKINLTDILSENHCEKCGKIYSFEVKQSEPKHRRTRKSGTPFLTLDKIEKEYK